MRNCISFLQMRRKTHTQIDLVILLKLNETTGDNGH